MVLSRDSRQATLELRTGGFYALHEAAGVRAFVPGFDFPDDPKAPALPLRRALVEAVVGRKVALAGVRALEIAAFPGLVPSVLGSAEMQVAWDGTVRAARRTGGAPKHFAASELARLLPAVFQGETKSAALELSPLRFDAQRRQIVLARKLRLRLLFTGREEGESGNGSRGRRRAQPQKAESEVVAQLFTTGRGLYAAPFEQLFPGERRGVAASELRLQRLGEAVAFHVEPDVASFGPGGRLYFFADAGAASTAYAPELAFELVRSGGGLRMPRPAAAPSGAAAGLGSPRLRRVRDESPLPARPARRRGPVALGGRDGWRDADAGLHARGDRCRLARRRQAGNPAARRLGVRPAGGPPPARVAQRRARRRGAVRRQASAPA